MALGTTSSAGVSNVQVTVGTTVVYNGSLAGAPTSVTLSGADGVYTVTVVVTDAAANTTSVSKSITLDTTGPTVTASLSAANNGTFYDVGTRITLTWTSTDLNGTGISSATIEGQTISASGGTIDVDLLTAGAHTVTITARDVAGNVTTRTLTFTIHATPQGIVNAINDGAARGWINASFQSTLLASMQQVIKGLQSSAASGKAQLSQFISSLQYPPRGATITPAFSTLLLSWANDLFARL